MDVINLHLEDLTEETVQAMTNLGNELAVDGKILNMAKRLALPPPGHVIT